MGKCPSCQKEIESLDYEFSSITTGRYSVEKDGMEVWDDDALQPTDDPQDLKFTCPECMGFVAETSDSAYNFLIK